MSRASDELIAARVKGLGRILDVGGARELSVHATHVLDLLTREQARAKWGRCFVDRPIPTENWVTADICGSSTFPFPDKYFDFVICGHTLEDVRDPIRVCRELSRVAKGGYVESPSPYLELTQGVDPAGRAWVGFYHHRWIVDVDDDGLVFLFKPHFLTASRRFHFPRRSRQRWQREGRLHTSLLWAGELKARERIILSREEMEVAVEEIVKRVEGRTMPMRLAEARARAWDLGIRWVDRLGARDLLRPVVGFLRSRLM